MQHGCLIWVEYFVRSTGTDTPQTGRAQLQDCREWPATPEKSYLHPERCGSRGKAVGPTLSHADKEKYITTKTEGPEGAGSRGRGRGQKYDSEEQGGINIKMTDYTQHTPAERKAGRHTQRTGKHVGGTRWRQAFT